MMGILRCLAMGRAISMDWLKPRSFKRLICNGMGIMHSGSVSSLNVFANNDPSVDAAISSC